MSPTDEYRKFQEETYFEKKNREALERLSKAQSPVTPRLSPVTGEPMEQVVLHGVVIDRCPKSGGIWLDAGELDELLKMHKDSEGTFDNLIVSFFKNLTGNP